MVDSGAEPVPRRVVTAAPPPQSASPPEVVNASGSYVQLGAFANQGNAERLVSKYRDIAPLRVVPLTNAAGQVLFHVRAGPYGTADASMAVRDKLVAAGADAHIIKE